MRTSFVLRRRHVHIKFVITPLLTIGTNAGVSRSLLHHPTVIYCMLLSPQSLSSTTTDNNSECRLRWVGLHRIPIPTILLSSGTLLKLNSIPNEDMVEVCSEILLKTNLISTMVLIIFQDINKMNPLPNNRNVGVYRILLKRIITYEQSSNYVKLLVTSTLI